MISSPSAFPSHFTPIIKGASQDVTNAVVGAAGTDDAELKFSTVLNGLYAIEGGLYMTANDATGDAAFRLSSSVGANTFFGRGTVITLTTADAIQTAVLSNNGASQTGTISIGMVGIIDRPVAVRFWYTFLQQVGDSTILIQFANAAAAAARTTRMLKGSWISWARIV